MYVSKLDGLKKAISDLPKNTPSWTVYSVVSECRKQAADIYLSVKDTDWYTAIEGYEGSLLDPVYILTFGMLGRAKRTEKAFVGRFGRYSFEQAREVYMSIKEIGRIADKTF